MKRATRRIAFLAMALLAGIAASGCWATQPGGDPDIADDSMPAYGVITTQQAVDVILALQGTSDFVLLDIRTPAEAEAGHISGAVNLDFYSSTFRDDLAALDRESIYLIYCRTGNRTGQAYTIMKELEFERVYDMGGGISQWIAAGQPVCPGPLDAEHVCTGLSPDFQEPEQDSP